MRLFEKRMRLVVAGLAIVLVLAVGFFVALGVRSVVAGPDSAPAGAPPNPGHSWEEIGLPEGTWPGLDADTVDGAEASELEESAEIDAEVAAHASDPSAHHTKTTDASEIVSGTMAPERIEGTAWTSLNDGAGSGLDADKVDGLHASELAGVPSGFSILGDTAIAPAGYTFTGNRLLSSEESWTTRASMPTRRHGLAGVAVNNKIYAIGGWDSGTKLATVEEYDPATATWTTRASMPTARHYLAAVAVNNKIYAIGGMFLATVEEYDPATDTWTTRANMPTARHGLAAVAVNNKIYAIGGYAGGSTTWVATVEEYDPATDTWTTRASMPTARHALAAAAVNNKIYAIGGNNGAYLATVEEYDPATDTWTTRASMPTARGYLAAAAVNNKIYAIGGKNGTDLATVEEYLAPVPYYVHKKS